MKQWNNGTMVPEKMEQKINGTMEKWNWNNGTME